MKILLILVSAALLLAIQTGKSQNYSNKTLVVKILRQAKSSQTNSPVDALKQICKDDFQEIKPVFPNFNNLHPKISPTYDLSNFYKINLKNAQQLDFYLKELNRQNFIEYAEPYPIAQILDEYNDPLTGSQYYLNNVMAIKAHDISQGDTNIVIGIVDSGVDLLHEDLKDNYKYNYADPINNVDDDMDGYIDNFYGWDLADDDLNPQSLVNTNGEANYHGTKVSGMASATTNNNIGIASLGYKTKILPIKAMDSTGYIVAGYEGIIYAADHGCQIINCSWGGNFPSKFAQEVINYAAEYRNCLIVAAAGNMSAAYDKRADTKFYPASYINVLSVAATGSSDIRWNGSSYATTVDVCAPGENVFFTKQNNTYGAGYGTSFASPLVAGLAGLLKASRPDMNQKQLAEQIRITSDVVDTLSDNVYYTKQLGYGRINAYRALSITDLPSIRVDSFNLMTNQNNGLLSGDTLTVTFKASNILAQATNTTIRLVTNSDFIVPINNTLVTGKLETFASVNNFVSPFLFQVKPNMANNQKVWFIFEFKAEGYNDYQVFEVLLNKNYIDINENNIVTTLTSDGILGYADKVENIGVGFVYDEYYNFLNKGGIAIGNSNTVMAGSVYDYSEFISKLNVDTTRNNAGDLIGTAIYSTPEESELTLDITQTTTASTKELFESTICYYYKLKNTGKLPLNKLKMSQFTDWNLYNAYANMVEFNRELNLFYTRSNLNEVIYVGLCLLNNMNSTPYGFDLMWGGNGGIDIINGFNNDLLWYTMNNERPYAGTSGDSINVACMLTTDFFSLNPDDSIELAFAHIVADNYSDLINKTIAAKEKYNYTAIPGQLNKNITLYPNPVTQNLYIEQSNTEPITIQVYDELGKLQSCRQSKSGHVISIDFADMKPGIYIINYYSGKEMKTAKVIKIP